MKLIIAGDFCITPSYLSDDLFTKEIISNFKQSDLNVVNLECPIISDNNNEKILKTGPHIYSHQNLLNHLLKLNVQLVTLANNHILDYGINGLRTTLEKCSENNISTVGAGNNLKEANEPVIVEKNGIKIAFINSCENEWASATLDDGGANPLDIIDNIKQIKKVRQKADFVFFIVHGGHEYNNLPSPRMVKQYRYIAENGADAIIGHHPHCIGGFEIHNKVPIFYSLGNMVFTLPSKHEDWYKGLILQFDIRKGESINWNIIPIKQSEDNFKLSLLSNSEKNNILKEVDDYSKILQDEEALSEKWKLYIDESQKQTLRVFSPLNTIGNRYIRAVLRRIGINRLLMNKRFLAPILNNIRCEALSDLSKEVISTKLKRK